MSVARQVAVRLPVVLIVIAPGLDACGEPLAPFVVGDDRGRARATVEQLRFGFEVVVEIGVEVEMVLREVRERPDREVHAIGPAERAGRGWIPPWRPW